MIIFPWNNYEKRQSKPWMTQGIEVSFETGIMTVYKEEYQNCLSNYQPISLLSDFNHLLQKLV